MQLIVYFFTNIIHYIVGNFNFESSFLSYHFFTVAQTSQSDPTFRQSTISGV